MNYQDEQLEFHQDHLLVENDHTRLPPEKWRILIVDDEEDVHTLTHFALDDYLYQDKHLEFISAHSAQEAKAILDQYSDIAVILLDVVMEATDAGLQLVHYIRETLQNRFVRIILRTGQPGHAPEKEVISRYDINDYKNKTELTDKKLFTVMTASLRAYSDLMELEFYRQHLEDQVAQRTFELQEKNQELMALNQELSKLNQEKTEFLRVAADNIKNPLSSIQELSLLIQRSFEIFPKPKLLKLVRIIEVSSQRMVGLIKNLLDANAIESGELNLSLGIFDFRPSLQFLRDDYLDLASDKDIKLHFLFPNEDEYKLLVNKSATLQVLDNLISNAIKYSPAGRNVYIRISEQDKFMRCEVQDEGPGLSDTDHAKLFGKFVRLTPQPIGDEHTTGLGLFIVKKLVEAMNGKVWCESELGKGSTFIVELPLANK
jgi:signal transduction histidine kinase